MSLFIIIITLSSSILVPNVKAVGNYIINDLPNDTYNNLGNMQCVLPNGKLVIAYISGGSETISIKVLNTDGTLYGETDYVYSASKYWDNIGIYAVSDTVVYIYGIYHYTATYLYAGFGVIKYNPSSLTSSIRIVDYSTGGSGGTYSYAQVSSMLLFNAKYYFMGATNHVDNNGANPDTSIMRLMEYVPDSALTGTTLKTVSAVSGIYMGIPNWFQSSIDSSLAYVMYSDSNGGENYYTINLSAKTQTLIAAIFSSGYKFPTNEALQSQAKFIGGDVIVNGTNQYLYFTWVYPQTVAGYSAYILVQDKMWFNGTITSVNFQSHISFTNILYSEFITTNKYWVYGYQPDKSTICIYFPGEYIYADYDVNQIYKATFTAHDWFDPDLSGWNVLIEYVQADNVPDNPNCYYNNLPLYFDFTSQYAVGVSASSIFIVFGLSVPFTTYLATVTYTPLDTPNLKTNTQYTFTVSTTIDGLPSPGLSVRLLINGREQSYKTTDYLGEAIYLITFTKAGYYLLTWEIYDPLINSVLIQYELNDSFTVTTLIGGVTPPTVISGWTNLLVMWVPVLGFIVAPMLGLAIIGGKYAGGIGMVIGMLGGGFAGVVGGTQLNLLPSYYLWLYLLFMGIALALAVTIGRSGGGSVE